MAVDLYANDPTVKFYFVITQDEPRKEKIDALWEKNNFRNMQVLYDANPKGKNTRNVVYKSMFPGTSGIPQKAILKNGRIRYRAEATKRMKVLFARLRQSKSPIIKSLAKKAE